MDDVINETDATATLPVNISITEPDALDTTKTVDEASFEVGHECVEEAAETVDAVMFVPPTPLFRLVFKDSDTFAELRHVVSTCIRDTLFARKHQIEVLVKEDEFSVYFNELDTGEGQNDSIFMIDTLPTEDENGTQEVPVYESTKAMLNNDSQNTEVKEDIDKPKNNCWNCGGDHMLRECTKPKDNSMINRAKNAFNRSKTERYHVDFDKFGQFQAGVISDDLRKALGMGRRDLPSYIYRMRLYGYPPGWLEDAKVSHSGLSLFVSETKEITDPSMEDGEVEGKIMYDPSRFISFPGFNTEMPRNVRDDYNYYNVPPLLRQQSKEAMIHQLSNHLVKTYKRKKLKHVVDADKADNNGVDMDLANSDDEEGEMEPQPPGTNVSATVPDDDSPMSPPACETGIPTATSPIASGTPIIPLNDSTQEDSSSLIDLQRQKRALLQALAENTDTSIDDSLLSDILDKTIDDSANASVTSAQTPRLNSAASTRLLLGNDGTPLGTTKSIVTGTPLLKTSSPFSKLPEGNSWSAGVSDVIDFENLPDAVGTYDKLSGLIKKVRSVVSRINDDNDAEDDED